MTEKKIIAVVGATGAQGSGLVHSILKDSNSPFSVRALTRNPDSEKARALAAAGAEVVAADVDDPESLKQAFDGCYGAFCVTFFWEHFSPEKETAQAGYMAQAAKQAGLEHVVWSTLEDTRQWVPLSDDRMPTLMNHYKVPHFDAKGQADQHFKAAGVPTTFMLTSFYWDNLASPFGLAPKKQADGSYALVLPMGDKKLPGIAAEDIGKCAYGIFKKGPSLAGERIGIAGEHLTGEQMAAVLSEQLGVTIAYQPVPPAVFRSFGFPGADDLGNMFQFKADFEADFCEARSPETSRSLNPELQTFADWVSSHKAQIPLEA